MYQLNDYCNTIRLLPSTSS